MIAGTARGVKLDTLSGLETRPTLDRVREAIFGSIQFSIRGKRCLDLFSGSGAMGIEALSRGAGECVFVDISRQCVRLIRDNLSRAGLKGQVIEASYADALESLKGHFDYVFMDPPYASGFYGRAAEIIKDRSLLAADGEIIAEHNAPLIINGYEPCRSYRYGKVFVTRFVLRNE